MSLRLITAPATFPVTQDEVKAQCRIDGNVEDDFIDGLIEAATGFVEDYTGRALIAQTWELLLDAFSDAIQIPKGPVQTVTWLKYFDADSVEQTIGIENYAVDTASDPQWLVKATGYTWPVTANGINNVTVRFVTGYPILPPAIKRAIMFLISQWYDNRTPFSERVPTELPNTVAALLANHRAYAF